MLARLRASAGCDAAAGHEADLLGRDVVWLFDEIGASAPLRAALAAVERRHRARPPAGAPGAVIVDLTATGHRASGGDVFTLDDDDRRDPVLARRLTTKKTVLLWQDIPENTFSGVCASAVGAYIVGGASAIAVVANQHVTARAILRRVRDEVADPADVTLVSGHMRPIDRADAEARLLPRIAAGHRRRGRDVRPIVVVGTQCLEAGPDFDFDALVSEGASLDALRQRFGRLNRLGELAAAPGAIVMRTRALADDPVYGVAARETAAWLAAQEHIDFAPARMQEPERALLARLVTRPSDQRPSGDGPSAAEVRVVWRRDLDESLIELAGRPQGAEDAWGARARRVVQESLTALPPSPPELMRLPLAAVRCWLLGLPEVAVTDLEGVPASNQDGGKATRNRPVVRWRDGVSETVRAADLAAGDVIIVPPSYGGVVEGNWDATSAASVADRAEESAFATHGTAVLRLHYSILKTAGIIEAPLPSPTLPDELVVGAWLERVKPRAGSWVGAMLERLQAARGRWHIRRVSAVSGADTYIISADPS
ncbi:MAG: hypothetical protein U1F43_10900 [Myxococcota bacterium]